MAARPLRGIIRVPGDKSLSHRVALFSALAEGTSRVSGLLDSLDVRSTLGAVEALGARVDLDVEGYGSGGGPGLDAADADARSTAGTGTVATARTTADVGADDTRTSAAIGADADTTTTGSGGLSGTITGWGAAGPRTPEAALRCGNSGTTARLLLGALSGFDISVTLVGDESLSRRPMSRVTLPLSRMGARFDPLTLPLTLRGSASLKALDYQSPIASAQVKSAVLLAGLNARGTTSVTEPHKSRDHTELLLPAYGVELVVEGLRVSVPGPQRLRAYDCVVPGDPSSAAFLLVAAALIPGSEVTVRGLLLNPTRVGFLEVMRRMGADLSVTSGEDTRPKAEYGEDVRARDGQPEGMRPGGAWPGGAHVGGERVGDVTLRYRAGLTATAIEAREVPTLIDEVPILALLATAAEGTTVFEQVGELRVKESDRLAAIVCGLGALGCTARVEGDSLSVTCGPPRRGAQTLKTHGDHRLAMTWAVAARAFDLDPVILGLESADVSYPGFLDDLKRLS